MKRAKNTIVILSLALASCRGPSYVPTATPQLLNVRILATTTTYPLLQDLASSYAPPGALWAVSSATASWDAVYAQLQTGAAPFALTTFVPPDARLWTAPLGTDGLVIIVHTTNTVPALEIAQVRRLFQGRITRWTEVGGPDWPVTVISREAGADTRHVFDALVMGQARTSPGAQLALSGRSMLAAVASTPGAVGYISLGQFDGTAVRAVPLSAGEGAPPVLPTREQVAGGAYPLSTPVSVVGLHAPDEGSAYYTWFAWMQSRPGQRVVSRYYAGLVR